MDYSLDNLPTEILDINGNLYFDTDIISDEDYEIDIEPIIYKIRFDYNSCKNIMVMYETANLSENDKSYVMLKMFYEEEIPKDMEKAQKKAMEFLNCGEQKENKTKSSKKIYEHLFSWFQDWKYIFSSINYTHNDILLKNPKLHWYIFNDKLIDLKEDCKYYEIINNRLAHRLKKATKEQQQARKDFPEIYILNEFQKVNDEKLKRLKEMQNKLNS